MKLINIGFGNLVNSDKLIAVVAPDAAPVKRIVQDAKSKGKTAVITGGNSGVGAATAMLFAKSGANVVISARRQAIASWP